MSMLDCLKFPPVRAYDKTCLMRTHLEWFYCAKAIAKTMGTDFSGLARRALQTFLPTAYDKLTSEQQAHAERLFRELMASGKLVDLEPDEESEVDAFWANLAETESVE